MRGDRDDSIGLGSCRAGMAWKTAGNGKKREIKMENGPKLDRGKNGKKWPKNGLLRDFSIFLAIFCHFCPCPAWGRFPFRFPCFFHFRRLAVFHAIPARQDPKYWKATKEYLNHGDTEIRVF